MPGTVDVRPKRHGNKLTLEFKQERAGAEPVKFEAFSMSASQSVRVALEKHLMGAGELLRSNALTAEETVDPA